MTPDEYELKELERLEADLHTEDPSTWDAARIERLLAGYAALRRQRDRTERLWQAQVDEMMRRRDELLDPMTERLRELGGFIETWARNERTDSTKSWKLPSGTIATRGGGTKLVVDDTSKVPDEWAEDRVTRVVPLDPIKRHMKATGEAVPGVRVEHTEVSVTITLPEPADE